MTQKVAQRIADLRLGKPQHSLRRIAEIIYDEHPESIKGLGWRLSKGVRGNQMLGQDLCQKAAEVLGLKIEDFL